MPTLIQASFAKGEFAPQLYGRVDTQGYQAGLRTARNVIIRAYGGASNRPGLLWIGPVKDHTYTPRLIEFQFKTTDAYILEFGNLYMRVIRNDAHVTEDPQDITGATQASPCVITCAGHGYSAGDEVFVDAVVGMTRLNGRRFLVGTATTDTFTLTDQVSGDDIDSTAFAAYISGGTVARIYEIVTPYVTADLDAIKYVQSADVMTLTHPSYTIRELSRTDHDAWTLSEPTFAPSVLPPTGLACTATTTGSVSTSYKVTTNKVGTLEESVPTDAVTISNGATPPNNALTWTAATNAQKYTVYRLDNGIYAFIGETETTSFTDDNLASNFDTGPPSANNPFDATGDYPGTASFYEQRRVFGGSANEPDTSLYSQTGSFANMTNSDPPQDDDAITATLNSREVNEIRHYVPGNDLIVLTSGAEWRVNAGTNSAFAATTIRQKPQSAWGCSHNRPIVVGNTILYVTENKSTVRSLGYSLQIDGYTGNDMTLYASHMFETYTVVDWAFARVYDPIAHIARSDGQLVTLTFNPEQEMIAWARWDTKGKFERTAALKRPTADEIDEAAYFVVKRFINGNTVRYIERTHSRRFTDVRDCFFVDAGASYDNPVDITDVTAADPVVVTAASHGFSDDDEVDIFDINWVADTDDFGNSTQPDQLNRRRFTVQNSTTDTFELKDTDGSTFNAYIDGGTVRKAVETIGGLDYLEGEDVAVLADGNVVKGLTVLDGAITLPRKFSRVHVGLGYVTDIETLNIEVPTGTVQGRLKKLATVVVRFERSRGMLFGHDSSFLVEMKQRQDEDMGDPTALLTDDKEITPPPEWNTNGRLFFRQIYPLPLTILDVIPFMV